jgi:hypothetical protein
MNTNRADLHRLTTGLAKMTGKDGEPIPGTPLHTAVHGNPLAGQKALTDWVQGLLGCDLERANELLGELSTSLEMATDVADLTE